MKHNKTPNLLQGIKEGCSRPHKRSERRRHDHHQEDQENTTTKRIHKCRNDPRSRTPRKIFVSTTRILLPQRMDCARITVTSVPIQRSSPTRISPRSRDDAETNRPSSIGRRACADCERKEATKLRRYGGRGRTWSRNRRGIIAESVRCRCVTNATRRKERCTCSKAR